jgi:transcriptional regulator GlxA family with amidase domain
MDSHLVRSPDPRIESAFAFIEANLHQKINLADMAERSGLSRSRFSHLFALAAGTTPGRYIRRMRRTYENGSSTPTLAIRSGRPSHAVD